MTTTVFFTRHGSHDRLDRVLCGRMEGVTLSADGRRQAAACAGRLRREAIAALYVSPLQRARETAEPVARALRLAPIEAADLNEIDYGEWTGADFAALRDDPRWSQWNVGARRYEAPGGETNSQVRARVRRWLAATARRHPDQAVAAFCHGGVIKAALGLALGLSARRYGRFEVSPGSISVLIVGDWGMKVHAINEIPA